ncbi:DUF4062 domain-containing protein [Solibacillus sp.]|uniref:DUF4062 domain-containing protein n=1 Tax=Solibacillus sp. TaxID=1909654 RepID=UPI00331583DB
MASPKIFVSSTCYDLKYIRENIKYFINTLGYESILSEEGDVYYNPLSHTHDSCLEEIPNCQLFVLIIGGRYGGKFKDTEDSITNMEYREAKKNKIPIFTLVEDGVYNDQLVFIKNKKNTEIDYTKIIYPSVDNIKIFEFIDEVRKNSYNNALVSFKNFDDIEKYLKKQWAGMLFNFLSKQNEENRLMDTLSVLSDMNERIEILSREILKNVGTPLSMITVKLYDAIINHEIMENVNYIGLEISPEKILENESIDEMLNSDKIPYLFDENLEAYTRVKDNLLILSKWAYKDYSDNYNAIREKLISILSENNMAVDDYFKGLKEIQPA